MRIDQKKLDVLFLILLIAAVIGIPAGIDFRVMNEQILTTTIGADKSKTFALQKMAN